MEVCYATAANVIAQLHGINALQSRFYIAGGMVPWLISDRDSCRMHGDIDLVVAQEDMMCFRQEMRRCGYYNPTTDAQAIWPHIQADYGFDVIIDGVTVNIAPFEIVSDGIIQRNASYVDLGSQHTAVTLHILTLTRAEYVTHTRWLNNALLGHYPLELVYATKLITNRAKDTHDCLELDRLGVCKTQVARYRDALQHMQMCIDSTNFV